jgi:hypothetical protein
MGNCSFPLHMDIELVKYKVYTVKPKAMVI